MGPGGEQGDSLVGWQSGVVASLADPKDGGNGMPNPARLMGTRERTEDGSQGSQREKRDRTSAAWQSRAELQSGVGWKWCHFPDVRGSPRRERRQKVLRRLFRRMSYERGTERGGRGRGEEQGLLRSHFSGAHLATWQIVSRRWHRGGGRRRGKMPRARLGRRGNRTHPNMSSHYPM